ncbi:52 kDa repressor of the inhibitor of the protein kinase-like [Centruroides sculpturatus]|uniref:52 kDa repressor of the inhibitor of the protein kinase-like n=1 Tax=Centruroides sculpturatus TaxID=218467 RepID=UPI000C6EAF9D|nr:52 kDa repressor of the inhibitor of the protein kinase-like [Centruroides sculpturatus]
MDKLNHDQEEICADLNCTTSKTDMRERFSFPEENTLCKEWVLNCCRYDLLNYSTKYLHQNYKLCSIHFEDNQFFDSKRKLLKPNAIPTKFNISFSPSNTVETIETDEGVGHSEALDTYKIYT